MNIIYALRDPNTDEYMYVGKSINGTKRAKDHFSYSHNLLVREWVQELASQEKEPIIDILEECPNVLLLADKEKFWINKLIKDKHPLLNIVVYNNIIAKYRELHRLKKEIEEQIGKNKNFLMDNKEIYYIEDICDLIKKRRKFAKLSRIQMAEIAGVGKTVIYDIENGKKSTQIDTLLKILKVLNIKLMFGVPR